MGMTLTDTLPQDAGNQKFLAPVNPADDQFALQRAANVFTSGSLEYADAGVAQGPRQSASTETHDSVGPGESESIGNEVDSDGYSKAGIFLEVGVGADIRLRLYGRLTTGGDNYLLDLVVDGQEESTNRLYIVDVCAPYLAVGLQAVTGSGSGCSCTVYLIP